MKCLQLYKSSLIILFTQFVFSMTLSDEECLEIGYRKPELSCLKCEEFSKFDLKTLKKSCLECCHKESSNESIKKYSSAQLEFCGCATHAANFPQTSAFIKSNRIQKYPNLTIKTVKGVDPVIKLMDAKGVLVEELNIQKWDTDTIDDFLSQHLVGQYKS